MSANDSSGYFVELGEYSLILAKANLGPRPRAVEELKEVWLGDNAAVEAALKELKAEGDKGKAVALLRLKGHALVGGDAALAKKLSTAAAVEDYLKDTLGADNFPANWASVSQKDGRPADGSSPLILDAIPKSATDEALGKITGWGYDFLKVESAPLALIGALSQAAKSAQPSGAILLCDVSELRSFLVTITPQGVGGFAALTVGFDALAEATQGALGLKFRGSAARLMFNESYDFTDSAAKIAEPLVNAIKAALPSLSALAPASLVCGGVLARQTWLTQAIAAGLNLKPLTLDANAFGTAQGLNLGKVSAQVAPSWLGVLGAVSAYDTRNPGSAQPWNPALTNTPVAPAPIIPAIIQDEKPPAPAPAPKAPEPAPAPAAKPPPAVIITPPEKKPEPAAVAPTPAIKPEPAKPAAPAPKAPEPAKPAVVITPPPKPVEPPKPTAPAGKTPPPPAKPVEPKTTAKPEPAKPSAAAKPEPAKPTPKPAEPAKPTPAPASSAASKPTLAPAPAPVSQKPATAAPFQPKKSSGPMVMIIVLALLVIGGGIGGYMYMQKKADEERRAKAELEQRAAQEAAARRAAEEKARQEAEARKKAEEEAAARAARLEQERIVAEKQAREDAATALLNARGRLILNTDPTGATVTVGELAPRTAPADFKELRLGRYSVTISLPGYDSEQREVEIKANELTDLGVIHLRRQVGSVEITSDPAGLDYELKPAGALFVNPSDIRRGQTPATLNDIPVGSYQLTINRPNWPSYTATISVDRNNPAKAVGTFVGGTIVVNSNPTGAAVMRDNVQIGTTPLTLSDQQPGDVTFTLTQRGLEPATVSGRIEAGKTLNLTGTLLDIDRVMRPSELDERPVPVSLAEPELPPGIRSEGGSATIEFVVGKDGVPTELKVLTASNPALGRACLAAAAKWKFRPGSVRGKPVRTRMTLPFKIPPES